MSIEPGLAIDLDRVASLLDGLGGEIEALGTELCGDPAVVNRHMGILQAIDRIGQLQRGLARVLRAESPGHAIDATGLQELEIRLRA